MKKHESISTSVFAETITQALSIEPVEVQASDGKALTIGPDQDPNRREPC